MLQNPIFRRVFSHLVTLLLAVCIALPAVCDVPDFSPEEGSAVRLPCNLSEITLTAEKNGADADLDWSAGFWDTENYQVFRGTVAQGLTGGLPWKTVAGLTTTDDNIGEADLLFYKVMPISSFFFILGWEGVDPDLTDDGFKPDPLEPYPDGVEDLTLSGDPVEFRVELTSLLECTPVGVELLLDRNADGDYGDAGEIIPLEEDDPLDVTLNNGKLYSIRLDGSEAEGTVPDADSPLYVRDENGDTRWDFAGGSDGSVNYRFRAWDASGYAGGPASLDKTFIALNTAPELIEDLGKPVVVAGACAGTTEWQTALVYFEEAEERVRGKIPYSPYNLALPPERNSDYLKALLASAISETGYTLANYETLFESPESKLYRDTMLDWVDFADEQVDRMEHLSQWALSEPNPPWTFDFPEFCIFLEDTGGGEAPIKAVPGVSGTGFSGPLSLNPIQDIASPASRILGFSGATLPRKSGDTKATEDEPVYTFEAATWDRTDAHLLAALFLGWRAAATAARVYEDPGAALNISCGDLGEIAASPLAFN